MNGQLDIENPRSRKLWRSALQADLLRFSRFFFKQRLGYKMKVAPHHLVICETLTKVLTGEIKRLIINLPPGYTKTELAVIHFIAWGLSINPKAKFIHVTYADSLALENSTQVRDIITSEEYEALWNVKLRLDSKAKGAWRTATGSKERIAGGNSGGGGMQARAAGGPITGFRAGQPEEQFSGAFIVDDPIKPDDAFSEPIVERINGRFNGVFRSRLMVERSTPMIVIMQRIAHNDPSGFLLRGGTNEKWHHLNLPAIIDNKKEYPKEYTHGIPIKHNLPDGALWDYKHTLEELKALSIADPYVFDAQYMQAPNVLGSGIFKAEWWKRYQLGTIIPEYRIITADTAQKTGQHNDFSVLQLWGYLDGNIYLMDQLRGRWEAPDLERNLVQFWTKHYGTGPAMTTNRLRYVAIEDKSSGTGLIQYIKKLTEPAIPVKEIPRSKDKLTRAMDTVPYIASGKVFIPESSPFSLDFEAEFASFSADMTHDFDDQVDPLMDACDLLLAKTKKKKGGTW